MRSQRLPCRDSKHTRSPRRPALPPCPHTCCCVQVKQVTLPTGEEPTTDRLAPLLSTLPIELRPDMERFIQGAFAVCVGRAGAGACA